MRKKVSVIIRTKNEERWIVHCLNGLFNQDYKDFEVIIVDNKSSDKTIEKAKQYKIDKIVICDEYFPGKALNMGIREAEGDYITCLSGHCIPVNSEWISNLIKNFNDSSVVGVYGRQEPMSFTPDSDKRDLALVFGFDRRVHIKDSFFHNANSMFRREIWQKIPFDETATNIEDRIWAQEILKLKYKIVYEPEARVYHYHGIHQNGDIKRCANVVRILDGLRDRSGYKSIDAGKLNIVAIIPVKGPVQYLDKKPLIAYTIKNALESKYIKKVIVSADNLQLAKIASKLGASVPFLREPVFSEEYVDLAQVLRYSLQKIEEQRIFPDLLVSLEVTFPFRPSGFLDDMILQLMKNGFDSIVAAKKENKAIWKEKEGGIIQLEEGLTPRQFKEPIFIELRGLGLITHPEFLRAGSLMGQKIGIYELNNPYAPMEVRGKDDFAVASNLISTWLNNSRNSRKQNIKGLKKDS